MAALYPFRYLNHIDSNEIDVPAQRYIHKFEVHRNEVARLKHHEKDFLFRILSTLHRETGRDVYDLFHIPEAKEFVFDRLILAHANQIMVFEGHIRGPYGELSEAEKRRNKSFFYSYLGTWRIQIEKGKGPYFSIIKPIIAKKLDDWQEWAHYNNYSQAALIKKTVFIYAIFYHIYYRVKLYFDERPIPAVIKKIGGFDVVFNVYSFVHILSRHYYPNINKDIGVSLNTELEGVNLDYLPDELLSLVEKHNQLPPLTRNTEYLLFSADADHYILWLKFKRLNETKSKGFEVRSFYKCEEQRDLDRVNEPGANVMPLV